MKRKMIEIVLFSWRRCDHFFPPSPEMKELGKNYPKCLLQLKIVPKVTAGDRHNNAPDFKVFSFQLCLALCFSKSDKTLPLSLMYTLKGEA